MILQTSSPQLMLKSPPQLMFKSPPQLMSKSPPQLMLKSPPFTSSHSPFEVAHPFATDNPSKALLGIFIVLFAYGFLFYYVCWICLDVLCKELMLQSSSSQLTTTQLSSQLLSQLLSQLPSISTMKNTVTQQTSESIAYFAASQQEQQKDQKNQNNNQFQSLNVQTPKPRTPKLADIPVVYQVLYLIRKQMFPDNSYRIVLPIVAVGPFVAYLSYVGLVKQTCKSKWKRIYRHIENNQQVQCKE